MTCVYPQVRYFFVTIFSRKARIDIYPKAMHLPTYPKPDPLSTQKR